MLPAVDTHSASHSQAACVLASDWRPIERNTLKGFFTLELPSGLVIKECSFHHKDGREWVGLPGKPQLDRDGTPRRDAATGKLLYTNVIEIPDRAARDKYQAAALAAVHAMLGAAVS
jgi:hypothetical protein